MIFKHVLFQSMDAMGLHASQSAATETALGPEGHSRERLPGKTCVMQGHIKCADTGLECGGQNEWKGKRR